MPMGLMNSASTFQRAMQKVLKKYLWKCCMVYIDDVIIFSKTLEELIQHVKEVLEVLAEHKFLVKVAKCKFLVEEIEFLGHVLG